MNLFQKFFDYPPEVFEQGKLAFGGMISPQVLVLALPLLAVVVWFAYRLVAPRTSPAAWRTVVALRLALLAVLLFILADPVLRWMHSRTDVFTAVLVDTSRSMAIADVPAGGAAPISRIDAAKQLLLGKGAGDSGLLKASPTSTVACMTWRRSCAEFRSAQSS
jgi:hypothetical protein